MHRKNQMGIGEMVPRDKNELMPPSGLWDQQQMELKTKQKNIVSFWELSNEKSNYYVISQEYKKQLIFMIWFLVSN
jgi:hypothetical protein